MIERLRAFWGSGVVGKLVIISGAIVVCVGGCCVLLVAIALLVPSQRTTTVTARTAQIAGATAFVEPTGASEPTTEPTQEPSATATATNTPAPTSTSGPTATPGPTSTPEPTPTPPLPADVVRAAITRVLLKGNRDVERVITVAIDPDTKDPAIYIRWSINDNLTEGLVKLGAQVDLKDMLKAIHGSGVPYSVLTADGLFPLVDTFGNTKETIVVHAVYKRETVDRINWENFLTKNIYQIADEVNIHPVFQP